MLPEQAGEVAAVCDANPARYDGNRGCALFQQHFLGIFYAEGGAPGAEILAEGFKAVPVKLSRLDAHLVGALRGVGDILKVCL